MPETDRLAKLIEHRQKQEKKNDKLRIHKNKIENGCLRTQLTYYEWSKVLRNRELESKENEYMRKLEKIYDRQMLIEERKIKQAEDRQKEKEFRKNEILLKQEMASVISNSNDLSEKDGRPRQNHAYKQEWTKSFINKAKSLSGGYRDNDPPLRYYKTNGLVPPDRLVAPTTSAEAQASFGGGFRPPPSSDHLTKPALPKETPYGVIEPTTNFRPSSSSKSFRTLSAKSADSHYITSSDDEDDVDDVLIDEVSKVNVRPFTAPLKQPDRAGDGSDEVLVTRRVRTATVYGKLQKVAEEPEVQCVEVEEPRTKTGNKPPRPISVRFNSNLKEAGEKKKSAYHGRRRGSMRTSNLMMFHKRGSGAMRSDGSGTRSAPVSPRQRSSRSGSQQMMLSNVEQERIRKKIEEKMQCLQLERSKRMLIAAMAKKGDVIPRRLRSATTVRELSSVQNYIKNKDMFIASAWERDEPSALSTESAAMMAYLDRCDRGMALADSYQAKRVLLSATQDRSNQLQSNVRQFVTSR